MTLHLNQVVLLAQFLQQNPKDINAWLSLARLIDDPKKKSDCYKRVVQLDPENVEAQEYLQRISRTENVSHRQSISSPPFQSKISLKNKKSIKNRVLVWAGILLVCSISVTAIYLVYGFVSHSKNATPIIQAKSPTPPKVYNQSPASYLPSITEMPNGFEIRYELEETGVLQDNAKTKNIGAYASRGFAIPDVQTNKINLVLYFVEVYADAHEAKTSYQSHLREYSISKTIKGDFDEGAYEIGIYDKTIGLMYFDETIRKSNIVISIRCMAFLDNNTDAELIAMWALFYQNLVLSKIQ